MESALNAAVATRGGNVAGVIFNSDRGAQYTSKAFADACAAAGVRRSMGAAGSSADNSLAEAFFASLKREILPAHGWPNMHQARLEVFRRLTFYNTRRRHSALGHLSPAEYEQRSSMPAAAAWEPVSTFRVELRTAPGPSTLNRHRSRYPLIGRAGRVPQVGPPTPDQRDVRMSPGLTVGVVPA
ncbi:integrase core domain-containing protein [Actinoallomurus sp. NBC_01490]|uniref:integrase core domain-containing protein n=1 Tax=Actinoallomurus sp. NBC_01490 TaxID=2903557 RepID=UPI002E353483|nr:integrase core domain-containing protein [Actinoallomurus sp. NBC_01490]